MARRTEEEKIQKLKELGWTVISIKNDRFLAECKNGHQSHKMFNCFIASGTNCTKCYKLNKVK